MNDLIAAEFCSFFAGAWLTFVTYTIIEMINQRKNRQ